MRMTFLSFVDQIMISGRALVARISGGNTARTESKSTSNFQSFEPDSRVRLDAGGFLGLEVPAATKEL